MSDVKATDPAFASNCFGCSPTNPKGLQLTFYQQGEETYSAINLSKHYESYAGTVHGGIASLIMDEVIVQSALKQTGVYAVTANLKLRYLTPMKVETAYLCKARVERRGTSSRIKGFAEIIDEHGAVVASAEGAFLLMAE